MLDCRSRDVRWNILGRRYPYRLEYAYDGAVSTIYVPVAKTMMSTNCDVYSNVTVVGLT